jgi:hypothetical protein
MQHRAEEQQQQQQLWARPLGPLAAELSSSGRQRWCCCVWSGGTQRPAYSAAQRTAGRASAGGSEPGALLLAGWLVQWAKWADWGSSGSGNGSGSGSDAPHLDVGATVEERQRGPAAGGVGRHQRRRATPAAPSRRASPRANDPAALGHTADASPRFPSRLAARAPAPRRWRAALPAVASAIAPRARQTSWRLHQRSGATAAAAGLRLPGGGWARPLLFGHPACAAAGGQPDRRGERALMSSGRLGGGRA